MTDVDDFDFICHVAFDKKPLTRRERANNVRKRDFLSKYSGAAREVLEALLDEVTAPYVTENTVSAEFVQNVEITYDYVPVDVEQDLEGLQTMRALGRNMAWLLSCIEAGKDAGINPPAVEPFQRTNFIR